MIDLDVMGGDTVVKERRREHHVISGVPKLWVILGIEIQSITNSDESESGNKEESQPEVHEKARIVEWTVGHSDESGEDWSHNSKSVIDLYPEEINNSERSMEGVLAVLSWPNFNALEDSSYESTSLGKSLIDEVLNRPNVFQEPSLKP